jgi:hypothetical protein
MHWSSLIEIQNEEYESVLPRIMEVIVTRMENALNNMSHGSRNISLYPRVLDTKQRAEFMRDQYAQQGGAAQR